MPPEDRRAGLVALCLSLPETTAEGDQHIAFKVRGRSFAYYVDNHHGDGRVALHCKAPPGENTALATADPTRFFIPPYLGPRGWTALYLDLPTLDWPEATELLHEAYRLTAPKRLSRQLPDPG